jgi:hypothetical protein
MRVRTLLVAAALCAAALSLTAGGAAASGSGAAASGAGSAASGAGAGIATCNQERWCTITASGDVTQFSSQLAIGNVSAGTELAVTQANHGQNQVGGEILNGSLRGSCGWSQYARDWTAKALSVIAGCPDPIIDTNQFVADSGRAVWSGCYPRCFGGVPLTYEARCGDGNHHWCYSTNCEEYANFYPWSPSAHPTDPIRMTHRHRLDVRYMARYGDAWTHTAFYLVRDIEAQHGTGNWVFISGAACGLTVGHPGTYRWLTHPSKPHRRPPSAHAALDGLDMTSWAGALRLVTL